MYLTPALAVIAAQPMTEELRGIARQQGWPEDVVAKLQVDLVAQEIVAYPDEITEQVADLEYGSSECEPRPAIRKFLNRKDLILGPILLEHTLRQSGAI